MDTLKIIILEDGTIKTDSDAVSMPNHTSAEGFLRDMARKAGGKTEIKMKGTHSHIAGALHEHAKDGHTHTH